MHEAHWLAPSSSQLLTFDVASIRFIQVPGPSLLFTFGRAADRRSPRRPPARRGRSLRTGFAVGVTNPTTIVSLVALLPLFVNETAGNTGSQLTVLGIVLGTTLAH